MEGALARLLATLAGPGRVVWIGLRPARRAAMAAVEAADIGPEGLAGDHARPGRRALTLLQAEHLPVIAALAQRGEVAPETLRRNLLISGLNLSALNGQLVRVGAALIRLTGPCAPCSRMEEALGRGGYTAMRGHGGWCAEVIAPCRVARGDVVVPEG
ncbi:MOSC domain-containing protein [Frigidibacter sp. SD6-1]|uniref:MOSC domain-containing protein n=1 Tax=Frigidibacter sp. SD6-1 TaxID=3032581 RepID=UPI0024DFCF9C|nr:MOSC domain-containing protein [Frigidibacter sp. SD6-1]